MSKATCLTKNSVRTEFKALGWLILIGLCLTGLLLFSDDVFGAYGDILDDFDSYPVNTELQDGTGDWFTEPTWPMKVVNDEFFSAPHSAIFDWEYGYRNGWLDLREYNAKDLSFKMYLKQCPIGMPFFITFRDWDLNVFAGFQNVEMVGDECEIVGYTATGNQVVGYVPLNTWTNWIFKQAIINDLAYVSYSVDGGDTFTDWWPIYDGYFEEIEVFLISGNANNVFYIDDIRHGYRACQWGSLDLCYTYETCVGAGGQWYYSMGGDYCAEPTSLPELCGTYWDCQYCETEFTCLEEKVGWCEWVNKGVGNKCYMVETIPPDQDWEVPVLDDCSSLSGVEFYLCEIKNDVLGLFMPTQEKISDLYLTIGLFKQRFPFNYVESLKTFFSDISESFDEEKTIPIKILGQEADVSFEFWDQKTEIGGIGETFKNILFDFTTFIILMGFFVWLLSLVKRFF